MERIKFWTEFDEHKNFGDYLSKYIYDKALVAPIIDADIYRLIGSVIDSENISQDLQEIGRPDARIAYWCCGMRDENVLMEDLRNHCSFFGIRGPLSRALLGLPTETPIGDPGLLLPIIYSPKQNKEFLDASLCVPHYTQISQIDILIQQTGADIGLSPAIRNTDDVEDFIDKVCSCKFLITGSLHAAIIASAYGRPFGFMGGNFVDIPFKWLDFAKSLGIEIPFTTTVSEAMTEYNKFSLSLEMPKLAPILCCCPFSVAPLTIVKALAYDQKIDEKKLGKLLDGLNNCQSQDGVLRQVASKLGTRKHNISENQRFVESDMKAIVAKVEETFCLINSRASVRLLSAKAQITRLNFTKGELGTNFLTEGWTQPSSEYGPWSLQPVARLSLPASLKWNSFEKLIFHGIFYVPHGGPTPSRRKVEVWINDRLCRTLDIRNNNSDDVVWGFIDIDLENVSLQGDVDINVSFTIEYVGSSYSLGRGSDRRLIGLSPSYVEVK